MEEFRPPQSTRLVMMVCAVFFLALIGFFVALPRIAADEGGGANTALISLSMFGVLLFGGLLFLSLCAVRSLPLAGICVDEDGIWPREGSKAEGLLTWEAMHTVRKGLQSLVVTDATGKRRVKIDRHLANSTQLRERVLDQVARVRTDSPYGAYQKTRSHYAGAVGGSALLIGLAAFTAYAGSLLVGSILAVFAVGATAYDFLKVPGTLEIGQDRITVKSATGERRIPFTAIRRVKLKDVQDKAYKFPYVELETDDDNNGFQLTQFGIDAPTLCMRLSQALQQAR
ncbi:MAG: hypothetical protein R6V11_00940 [Ectothiorhodospiraceae bacterium]